MCDHLVDYLDPLGTLKNHPNGPSRDKIADLYRASIFRVMFTTAICGKELSRKHQGSRNLNPTLAISESKISLPGTLE